MLLKIEIIEYFDRLHKEKNPNNLWTSFNISESKIRKKKINQQGVDWEVNTIDIKDTDIFRPELGMPATGEFSMKYGDKIYTDRYLLPVCENARQYSSGFMLIDFRQPVLSVNIDSLPDNIDQDFFATKNSDFVVRFRFKKKTAVNRSDYNSKTADLYPYKLCKIIFWRKLCEIS